MMVLFVGSNKKKKSDGCTCWFDGLFGINWRDCCVRHDKRYANKKLSRKQADILLYRCVKKKCVPMAVIMYIGVRMFGWYRYNKIQREQNG